MVMYLTGYLSELDNNGFPGTRVEAKLFNSLVSFIEAFGVITAG
jgi:hypothetical protein